MRRMPIKMRNEMSCDPFYSKCIHDHLGYGGCSGRIEWEHALIYAGKQVNEIWAIVPCCVYHHRGNGLIKHLNVIFALLRASEEDFNKYYKRDWIQYRSFLCEQFPEYTKDIKKFLIKENRF